MSAAPEAIIQARAAVAAPLRRAWAELAEPGTVLRVHEEALDAPEASPWLRLTLTPRLHRAPLHIEQLTTGAGDRHLLRVEARLEEAPGALPASLSWMAGHGALELDGLRWPLDAVRWSPDDPATRTLCDLTRAIGLALSLTIGQAPPGVTLLSVSLDASRVACAWQLNAPAEGVAIARLVEACVTLARDHERFVLSWEEERQTTRDELPGRLISALARQEASAARHDLLVQLAARPLTDDTMRSLLLAALRPAPPEGAPAALRDLLERHPDTRTLWAIWEAAPGHVSRLVDAGLTRWVWHGSPPPDPARAWALIGPLVLAYASPDWLPGGAPVLFKRALWPHLRQRVSPAALWGALVDDAMQCWGEPPDDQLQWWREAVEALVVDEGAAPLVSLLNTPARRAVRAWLPEGVAASTASRALIALLDDAQG